MQIPLVSIDAPGQELGFKFLEARQCGASTHDQRIHRGSYCM